METFNKAEKRDITGKRHTERGLDRLLHGSLFEEADSVSTNTDEMGMKGAIYF